MTTVTLYSKCFILQNFYSGMLSWSGEQFMQLLRLHQYSLCFNFGAGRFINQEALRTLSTSFNATHYD
jgi:hypothetical protein